MVKNLELFVHLKVEDAIVNVGFLRMNMMVGNLVEGMVAVDRCLNCLIKDD